jgi:hypothetical protein
MAGAKMSGPARFSALVLALLEWELEMLSKSPRTHQESPSIVSAKPMSFSVIRRAVMWCATLLGRPWDGARSGLTRS